jgi:hypothetical protein
MLKRMNTPMTVLAVMMLALSAGCPKDEVGGSDGGTDGTLPIGGGNGNGTATRTLALNGSSPITLFFQDHVDLAFTLSEKDGSASVGAEVSYSLNGNYATLSAASSVTTSQGIATVRLTGGNTRGNVLLTASAVDADDVTVTVNVKEATDGTLIVQVNSGTRIPVSAANVRVYRGANGSVTQTCSGLTAAATLPNAAYTADLETVPGEHQFDTVSHNSNITVWVDGSNADGMVVGHGCVEGNTIQGGADNVIVVTITQEATTIANDYDALLHIDLATGLPEPYDTYVNTTADVFGNPVGYGSWLALKSLHKQLMQNASGEPCLGWGDLVDDAGNPYETGAGVARCYALALINIDLVNANTEFVCDDYAERETECATKRAECIADASSNACSDVYCNDGVDGIFGTADDVCSCYASFDCVADNANHFITQGTVESAVDGYASENETYVALTTAGVDLEKLVTDFEVGVQFGIQDVDSNGNAMPEGTVHIDENWREYVFNWSLGCDANDLGCSRRAVTIPTDATDPNFRAGMSTDYNASYTQQNLVFEDGTTFTERYRVIPDTHSITLHYGNMILLALEQVVFPSICEGCDSMASVLNNFIGCRNDDGTPGPGAESIAGIIPGGLINEATAATLCESGLAFASTYAENQISSNLELTGEESAEVKGVDGLAGGGVFYLVDEDMNLETEYLRDVEMTLRWSDSDDPLSSTDTEAGIVGYGRVAAADCMNDSACAASGTVCAPVPHYLEIAMLEMDCVVGLVSTASVNVVAGGQACTADEQCKTGLCIDLDESNTSNTIATGICYMACDPDGAAGQCINGQLCEEDAIDILIDGQTNANGEIFGAAGDDYYGNAAATSCMPDPNAAGSGS